MLHATYVFTRATFQTDAEILAEIFSVREVVGEGTGVVVGSRLPLVPAAARLERFLTPGEPRSVHVMLRRRLGRPIS